MRRVIPKVLLLMGACGLMSAQSAGTRPRFVAADVHASRTEESRLWTLPVSDARSGLRGLPVRDGFFEVKGATMLDLVSTAYGWEPWKIAGGPNWLELDRFDVTAKLSGETPPEERKLMLQMLLEDRFRLVVNQGTKPISGYVLTAGKRPALKRAAGSEKSGCAPQVSATPTPMDMTQNENGPNPVRYTLGPGSTVTYHCRNVTMEGFAAGLQGMIGANLSPARYSMAPA